MLRHAANIGEVQAELEHDNLELNTVPIIEQPVEVMHVQVHFLSAIAGGDHEPPSAFVGIRFRSKRQRFNIWSGTQFVRSV